MVINSELCRDFKKSSETRYTMRTVYARKSNSLDDVLELNSVQKHKDWRKHREKERPRKEANGNDLKMGA